MKNKIYVSINAIDQVATLLILVKIYYYLFKNLIY